MDSLKSSFSGFFSDLDSESDLYDLVEDKKRIIRMKRMGDQGDCDRRRDVHK
jgi:hypothetical protein